MLRKRWGVCAGLLLTALLAGCGGDAQPEVSPPTATSGAPTATQPPTATATEMPTDTATPTPEPTATPSPTPAPLVRVSNATNCRSGPAESFPLRGVLEAGESAQLAGRTEGPDYLYVTNPDNPGEHCWLWAEFASVQGDEQAVPVYTPAPSPTPLVGFELYVHSFQGCSGDTRLVLIVRNAGARRLMTAEWGVFDLQADDWVRPPRFERHPFADSPVVCPPGHGNILDPGAGAFMILSLGSPPSGNMGYATVQLCSGDFLAGDCATKEIYFSFP